MHSRRYPLIAFLALPMREIANLLGVEPQAHPMTGGVDESRLILDTRELQTMSELAHASLRAIMQLQVKSSNFESEIGQLSSTMAALKTQSATLHHKLATRDAAIRELDPLLEHFVPSSKDIDLIFEGEIDTEWYAALERVRQPLTLPPEFATDTSNSKLLESAQRLRKVLLSRALERAKTLLLVKLRTLRKPGVNAQVVQANLLDAAPALQLLSAKTPRLASSLGKAYRNTMKWYYTMLFGKYGRWLGRQPLATVDQPKLLGNSISVSKSFFFSAMGSSDVQNVDAFSVGARPTVLSSDTVLPMTAVPSHASPYYPIEILVHSLLGTLADSWEWESKLANIMPGESSLHELFAPTLDFYGSQLKSWITQCTGDLFGLLLVVKLINSSPLQQWEPEWLAAIADQCWPHINSICNQQTRSIEQAALKASTQSSANQKGPHMLTQLVSSYFSGVLQVCGEDVEPSLHASLRGIIEAYELFISKLAGGKETVLHTNYFVMAALLSDIPGTLAHEFAQHFQLLVNAYQA